MNGGFVVCSTNGIVQPIVSFALGFYQAILHSHAKILQLSARKNIIFISCSFSLYLYSFMYVYLIYIQLCLVEPLFNNLLKLKLPYDPVFPSVGRLVGWSVTFLKGREVSFSCSYWSFRFFLSLLQCRLIDRQIKRHRDKQKTEVWRQTQIKVNFQ